MMKKTELIIWAFLCMLFSELNAQENNNLLDAYGFYYSGNYTQAIPAFDRLIKENISIRPVDLLFRGISKYQTRSYEESLSDLVTASLQGFPEGYLWQARAYTELGKYSEAVSAIHNYLRNSSEIRTENITSDPVLRKLNNTDEWDELWRTRNNSETEEIIAEAEYLANKQKYQEAHNLIESSFADKEIELLFCDSKIYEREGNIELAINVLNKGLKNNPGNRSLLYQKALYLISLKKYEEAYTILTELLTSTPEDFPLRFKRAGAAFSAGNLDIAKSDIELYLKYFSTEEAVFLAGRIEYASGRYLNALRYFNDLLEDDTSNAEYFKARGLTYYQTHTFQQAAYDLSMSLDLVPDDPEANYYLGLSQHSLGNEKMACYYMNRAKKYGELKAIEFLRENCSK